ncbi:hypothetical protein K2173_027791 [Erythroxylum novogranatense]|uniref:Uncharacterized protein n=1 Tax=Erythroxylum novogranatense TaxID=1862640 RepID=A0AAV8U305_9ROSI|nr:hypothetical protein K2173_027791 [Erythroxylum novogranatense]
MAKLLQRWDGHGGGSVLFLFLVLVMVVVVVQVKAQQAYVNNKQLDCENPTSDTNSTRGFLCNGDPTKYKSSCKSYLTFRSTPTYDSAVDIGYLLGVERPSITLIASINNISSDVSPVPTDTLVIVPIDCSCYNSSYYQHNASYILKQRLETYFSIANNTYQGLTTCQALMAQNPYNFRNLSVGLSIHVPLRCACPTSNQTASGVNYLLTYLVNWGDSISSIAQLFGVQEQRVLDANRLSAEDVIFPFTPILVPLNSEPKIHSSGTSPPPQSAPGNPIVNDDGSSNSKNKWKWIGIGIGGGALLLLLLSVLAFLFWRRSKSRTSSQPPKPKAPVVISSDGVTKPWSHEISYAVDSLTLYRFEDLENATAYFGETNRIKESVYRGSFKGDAGVVKVLKGDVSAEINILKMINHSNIIRLSGFCVHQGNTYLVYEYAENGSLRDWLHNSNKKCQEQDQDEAALSLSWKQRVQIAYDVAGALSYLHNYTNPPYIHKNLKTSNILLDANLSAKVANFGLARRLDNDHMQLTRHVVGTQGYMPPEYIENGLITPKLDVFAFGVVMLELLSGREPATVTDNDGVKNHQLLSEVIKTVIEGENVREKLRNFMDPCLGEEYPLNIAFSMAQLANVCVHFDVNERPSMPQVVATLSKILSSSLDWDPSDHFERSSSTSLGLGR